MCPGRLLQAWADDECSAPAGHGSDDTEGRLVVDDASRILAGRYEVGELIGRGGMAEVHIGHDNRLGRTVAIKILRSDLARDPSFQARFRREAQAAAALNHPAIVAVYDTGEDNLTDPATGSVSHVPFIVMEYVEGHTVRDILGNGNAVPIEEAIEITSGVLSALEYSHHAGIVHRDIKPANVMLTPTGSVKVMDFGIARALADSAATMTQTQAVIGTAQYLSPEQARGETVDARSDLYSTGCLLFELLTGRPPFTGDSPVSVAYQHVREQPPVPSSIAADVPDVLDHIVLKALAKDRDARYGSAAAFRADLEASQRGGAVAATASAATTQILPPAVLAAETKVVPPPVAAYTVEPEPEPEEKKSRKKVVIWSIVGVLVVAALAVWAILAIGDRDSTPPVAQVAVPVVVDLDQDEAIQAIKAAGFTSEPKIVPKSSTDVEKDRVISSDPDVGKVVAADTTIVLVVSTGPDSVTIPDVKNLSQQQAQQMLEGEGLVVIPGASEESPDVAKDAATRTEPAAGETAVPGDEVTLFTSTGLVKMPDLVGMKQAAAEEELQKWGLTAKVVEEESSDVKAGRVISQDQSKDSLVSQHSVITLKVAIKPVAKTLTLPTLAGMTEAQAQDKATTLNLEWTDSQYEASDTVPAGQVIRTDPAAGTQVTEGDTITLVVSTGPATTGTPTPPVDGDDG